MSRAFLYEDAGRARLAAAERRARDLPPRPE